MTKNQTTKILYCADIIRDTLKINGAFSQVLNHEEDSDFLIFSNMCSRAIDLLLLEIFEETTEEKGFEFIDYFDIYMNPTGFIEMSNKDFLTKLDDFIKLEDFNGE